jgi:hypothetical protein
MSKSKRDSQTHSIPLKVHKRTDIHQHPHSYQLNLFLNSIFLKYIEFIKHNAQNVILSSVVSTRSIYFQYEINVLNFTNLVNQIIVKNNQKTVICNF